MVIVDKGNKGFIFAKSYGYRTFELWLGLTETFNRHVSSVDSGCATPETERKTKYSIDNNY